MIQEIIPAFTPHKTVKMLSADRDIMNKLPPIDSHISFLPFVKFLKDKLAITSGTRADFYRYLIKKFEAEPALLQQVTDVQILDDHEELLELLSTVIFPVVSDEGKNNFTLSAPYQFNIFSYSEPFRKLFIDEEETKLKLPGEISETYLKQVQCSMIYDHVLEKYYGIQLNESPELVYPVTDADTGMKRYFRMRYDRRFIDVHLKGELPPIQDCAVCLNTFRILDLDQQLKKMPLELFEVEGFAVWVAEDVTTGASLDRIKKILLRPDDCSESLHELKNAVLALAGLNDIDVGLMPFVKVNNNFLLNEEYTGHSLLGKHWRADDEKSITAFYNFLDFQKQNPEPMPITNVTENVLDFARFLRPLFEKGTRSYIFYPMQNSDGVLGMLELSSPVPNLFTHAVMSRLEPAIPLLSLAMLKIRDAFDDRIELLVKEKFTALQPSVEWKFSEVAWEYLKKNDSATETRKIIFENVYPLFGAIDIRNSSVERNHAIQKDLKQHLHLVDDTLAKLQSLLQLNLLEGLKFKNMNFMQTIENGLLPDDEVHINEFLRNEAEPVFSHLEKSNSNARSITENYFSLQKNCSGPLYHYRNEYEETLTTINQALLHYLQEQEENLQKSYPHYFEKYRTDGVEYNIYIGQSMAPHHPFDQMYLKNIRLWQLQSMAEMGRITHRLLPELKVPLETTQLILIHNQLISISFRKDERRFDVEGSYNIRYEVMKKRIDKAMIKDTRERLTQPGKISMVYCNQKEAQEYEEYIHFVQSKGLLQPGIEMYDLEEMQGLSGLKALRVSINLDD
jgi:hypothetical protein